MKLRIFSALMLALLVVAGAQAGDDGKDKNKHPLLVLKGTFSSDNGGFGAMRGDATIWLKNISDVAVDGVKVEMELFNQNGRKVHKMTRDIGELPAGDKKFIDFEWEVYGVTSLKPRVWVYYNGGGEEPVKFEGEPPIWSGM
ncbi:MAG: FxLYD domain-containing protein [Candidatus Eremiobacterota bacterium]